MKVPQLLRMVTRESRGQHQILIQQTITYSLMKNITHVKWHARAEKPYIVNLSPGFKPMDHWGFNEILVEIMEFPGGDPHVKLKAPETLYDVEVTITCRVNTSLDMMHLLLTTDALRGLGFTVIDLFLPCIPGARQDRRCARGEPLTAKVFANLINAQGYREVLTFAPHSDVAPALIDNCYTVDLAPAHVSEILKQLQPIFPHVWIVAPDAGAVKRVYDIVMKVRNNPDVKCTLHTLNCGKTRDVKTGELSGFTCPQKDLQGFPFLILDDIVAYGGTFIGLSKLLMKCNAGPGLIYTSHADCVDGLVNLTSEFQSVFTTNSKLEIAHIDGVTVLPIKVDI